MASVLRKRAPQNGEVLAGRAVSGGSWSESFPGLVEFLAVSTWPDGSPRVPGSLVLFTDDAAWKGCLSDKDQDLVAFVTAPSPSEVLVALEEGLLLDKLDWRPNKSTKGSKRRS